MKPSVKICDEIRCSKFFPWKSQCTVFGKVAGHMDRCPEGLINSYEELIEEIARSSISSGSSGRRPLLRWRISPRSG
jgi:hypothetical protein